MSQFETWIDERGNLIFGGGSLIDISGSPTAVLNLSVASGQISSEEVQAGLRKVQAIGGQSFQGGSGTNVISSGTVSGTNAPTGFFVQTSATTWQGPNGQIMTFNPGTGVTSLDDGTGQIATISSSTTAPDGTFNSTTYGANTYNGGTAFTLSASYEGRTVYPGTFIEKTGGTAQGGSYSSTAWGQFVSDINAAWTITVDPSGSAILEDGTGTVAERAAGIDGDGTGVFIATTYGQGAYNSGNPFSMIGALIPVRAPISGYLYVTINLTSGVPTSLSGPAFAVSMPANSSTAIHIPVCKSDGTTVYQIQQGPILWK